MSEQEGYWLTLKRPDQSIVHIVPTRDFEPHAEDAACQCQPELLPVDDAFCDLLLHHPYDPDYPINA